MMAHAFAHGVVSEVKVRKDGQYTAVAEDALGRHRRTAKHGRDALEQALCLVSFDWEDKDRAAAFRTALCHGTEDTEAA